MTFCTRSEIWCKSIAMLRNLRILYKSKDLTLHRLSLDPLQNILKTESTLEGSSSHAISQVISWSTWVWLGKSADGHTLMYYTAHLHVWQPLITWSPWILQNGYSYWSSMIHPYALIGQTRPNYVKLSLPCNWGLFSVLLMIVWNVTGIAL